MIKNIYFEKDLPWYGQSHYNAVQIGTIAEYRNFPVGITITPITNRGNISKTFIEIPLPNINELIRTLQEIQREYDKHD